MITLLACTTAPVRSPFHFLFPVHTPCPLPYAACAKSSSYWTALILSLPDLPDILCLPSSPLSCTPPGTNLALGCLFGCLSCSNYSNCAWRGAVLTCAWPNAYHTKSSTFDKTTGDLRAKSSAEQMKTKACCNWFNEDGVCVFSGALCV